MSIALPSSAIEDFFVVDSILISVKLGEEHVDWNLLGGRLWLPFGSKLLRTRKVVLLPCASMLCVVKTG